MEPLPEGKPTGWRVVGKMAAFVIAVGLGAATDTKKFLPTALTPKFPSSSAVLAKVSVVDLRCHQSFTAEVSWRVPADHIFPCLLLPWSIRDRSQGSSKRHPSGSFCSTHIPPWPHCVKRSYLLLTRLHDPYQDDDCSSYLLFSRHEESERPRG